MKIAVIGSGGWGTAVSVLLASKGYDVYLWSWQKEESKRLAFDRENKEFLPGIKLDSNIYFSHSLEECIKDAMLVVTATPSVAVSKTTFDMKNFIKEGQIVLNISKGLEPDSLKRLSEVIAENLPQAKIAVMSGPSHAEEVARGIPTTNVVASDDRKISEFVQDIFMHKNFRVYTSDDIIGVELGGALKNVIALAVGISVGLGFGDNSAAALMTRGIAEIARLGASMGAKAETFSGLTGIGDLIVTCMSRHSRNRRAGVLIGQGKSLDEAKAEVHMVVEGVNTCKAAYALAKMHGVSMPIVASTYNVLFGDMKATDAAIELMGRERRHETEEDILLARE